MQPAQAFAPNATTFLTHIVGLGLADKRYVVQRFKSMLGSATRRASPVPASPSTGSRTARCTTRRTGVSARARAPAERPRTLLRIAPGSRVHTGADISAGASAAVLRTTPCSSRCTSRPLKRRGGSDAPLSPAPISRTFDAAR